MVRSAENNLLFDLLSENFKQVYGRQQVEQIIGTVKNVIKQKPRNELHKMSYTKLHKSLFLYIFLKLFNIKTL